MVEAEECARIEAGVAIRWVAMRIETPNANHANGISSNQFCQFIFSKPGALFSVNR